LIPTNLKKEIKYAIVCVIIFAVFFFLQNSAQLQTEDGEQLKPTGQQQINIWLYYIYIMQYMQE